MKTLKSPEAIFRELNCQHLVSLPNAPGHILTIAGERVIVPKPEEERVEILWEAGNCGRSLEMKTLIIAEAGVNHNGSLNRALDMVDVAAAVGADVVKFQTFNVAYHITENLVKAPYQVQNDPTDESQYEMLRRLALGPEEHVKLLQSAKESKIEFLSSAFDIPSAEMLIKMGVSRLKVASGEITNDPLLFYLANSGLPLIISTGMSTLDEIRHALDLVGFCYLHPNTSPKGRNISGLSSQPKVVEELQAKVTLLHCTSSYPTLPEEVNLRALDTLFEQFRVPIGYSDHTEGIAVSLAAVARGAVVIEKHFTLDKELPGPDQKSSLDPGQFRQLVEGIRDVEKSLGSREKRPGQRELEHRWIVRKSLVAMRSISKGDEFNSENLGVKRPGSGVSPSLFWDYLGKRANRDYKMDDLIDEL